MADNSKAISTEFSQKFKETLQVLDPHHKQPLLRDRGIIEGDKPEPTVIYMGPFKARGKAFE